MPVDTAGDSLTFYVLVTRDSAVSFSLCFPFFLFLHRLLPLRPGLLLTFLLLLLPPLIVISLSLAFSSSYSPKLNDCAGACAGAYSGTSVVAGADVLTGADVCPGAVVALDRLARPGHRP